MLKVLILILSVFINGMLIAQNIEVAVHRGANRWAPENTMPAARLAAELGGDYLEIDVRQNKEGFFFNFHDGTIDRTTNGTGDFYSLTYEEIKSLDAGSWFRHRYAGEKVPTVEEIVKELKGKIKFYFDFKYGDIHTFIAQIRKWGVADDCFFTLQPEHVDIVHQAGLAFKVNVSNIEELVRADEKYNLPMVEVRAHHLSDKLVAEAHKRGIKIMVYVPGDQYELYQHSLQFDIDLINLDNPDVFQNLVKSGKYIVPQFILHRGGIVNANWTEFNPEGIQAAVHAGYPGFEFDVRQSVDRQLVVHHDASLKKIFGVDRLVKDLTLKELKALKSVKGDYQILTLEEYLALLPQDVLLMPDLKTELRNQLFYEKLRVAIEHRHALEQCVFIKDETRNQFWGEARFKVLTAELPKLYAEWQQGKDVACHYFLFDDGNKIPISSIRLAQKMSMDIIAPINTFHYKNENMLMGGRRDIQRLLPLGVRYFQVDAIFVEDE